ncbi:MAG: RnfABCDGE type electron transport complex subunit D [Planctomycetota bacterium]
MAQDVAQEAGDGPFLVGVSPHVRSPEDVARLMWSVVLALVPAWLAALFFFGPYAAVFVVGLSVATAVLTEAVIQKLKGGPVTVSDGSAVVTGVLYAFVLPPNAPWYVVIVGAFVAIAIVKQAFGGLGCNIWNPALVGRAFVHLSFATPMNLPEWPVLQTGRRIVGNLASGADAVTSATPLSWPVAHDLMGLAPAVAHTHYRFLDLFLGARPGCIGEVSALALLIGGIYLIARKVIDWRVPVFMVAAAAVMAFVFPYLAVGHRAFFPGLRDPGIVLYHVLSGGLLIGAFFMATDYVTTPLTRRGLVVFGIGAGALVGAIRLFSRAFPEGVCFAILLMNTATALMDRWTLPRVFGGRR